MLITLDEELNPLEVSVRVGQAVDTVGQAGKPKTITGFQTHTTPVLIAQNERAELATDDCTFLSFSIAFQFLKYLIYFFYYFYSRYPNFYILRKLRHP